MGRQRRGERAASPAPAAAPTPQPRPALCLQAALREYRMLHMRGAGGMSPNALVLPERLKSMPLLSLALTKTAALRGTGRDVNSDERTAVGHQMMTGSVPDLLRLIYPACYPVHDPAGGWGRPGADGQVELPPTAPAGLEYFNPGAALAWLWLRAPAGLLGQPWCSAACHTSGRFCSHPPPVPSADALLCHTPHHHCPLSAAGAYVVDNGRLLMLWVGQAAPPAFYHQVFGLQGPPQDNTGARLLQEWWGRLPSGARLAVDAWGSDAWPAPRSAPSLTVPHPVRPLWLQC